MDKSTIASLDKCQISRNKSIIDKFDQLGTTCIHYWFYREGTALNEGGEGEPAEQEAGPVARHHEQECVQHHPLDRECRGWVLLYMNHNTIYKTPKKEKILPASNSIKRKISIIMIYGITYGNIGNEFVIHVPMEYDYRFQSSEY
jgi:hypothetical protein